MLRLLILCLCLLLSSTLIALPAAAQQDTSSSQSANDNTVEGTISSASRDTLVVHGDDGDFHLFTYARGAARPRTLAPGTRVRVTAGAADENGTRSASNVTVISQSSGAQGGSPGTTGDKGAQAAPVPDKVRDIESQIKRQSRRWRLGVEAGQAFNPELFMFGVQSQMGPIFHPRVLFRPNAEFDFGEVTDLVALNLEAIYRFSPAQRRGEWTPFLGAGPALIFIHQNFQAGRQIDFGNFDYETGFNILAGIESRRGMFGELKTSLYSGPAPRLRLIIGYTF
jgi:hypothetical protein